MAGRISQSERLANRVEVLLENVDNRNDAEKIGFELLRLVQRAQTVGVDAEGALRQTLKCVESSVVRAELGLQLLSFMDWKVLSSRFH